MRTGLHRVGSATLALALTAAWNVGPIPAQEAASGKLPITTVSEEAHRLYVQGRDLQERLRAVDARSYYQEAVGKDPDFALAHLGLANTATSAKEFFESLSDAVERVDNASQAERLLIMATDAGVKGVPAAQREYLSQLVQKFPADERAHTALGNFHFGRQEWEKAIEHYGHATEINPEYSPPYNNLGYAHRFLKDYAAAEVAFKKYIELIPDEPNPYDSYAELLMKVGRFDESIQNYRRALEQDAEFFASYVGIGNNQMFMGRGEDARSTFQRLHDEVARNDGQRRGALFWIAASYVHEGDTEAAMEALRTRYAISERASDFAALSGDLNLMGNVLLQAGQYDEALKKFERSVEMIKTANVPAEVKEATRRNHLYNLAHLAALRGDLATAKEKAEAYGVAVHEHSIPFELRQHHEVLGLIAIKERSFDSAVAHLEQANQQNPRVNFLTAEAYHGADQEAKAQELLEQTANFNGLNFNYAYVRSRARQMLNQS